MIRTINIASIRLTAPIEAMDKGKDKTTIYIKAVKGVYTEEINDIEETKKTEFLQKRYYICNKLGCWSTKYTVKERKRVYKKFY